jgi:predicted  nucleic acid-binding Zn-ribbon protein
MTNNDLDRLEQAKTFTERVGAIPRADRGDFDDNGNLVFVDDVLAIAHDADERVRTEREARETAERERDDYKKELELRTHQVITCGVFAHHSDVSKVKDKKCYAETWATAQSRDVLKLREERDALAQQVEALTAENKTLRVMLPPLHNKIAELKQDAAILQEDIDELHTLLNDLNAERGSMKEV